MTSAAKLRHVLSRDLHVLRNVAIKEVALRKALSLQNKSIYRILILNFNTNVNLIDVIRYWRKQIRYAHCYYLNI